MLPCENLASSYLSTLSDVSSTLTALSKFNYYSGLSKIISTVSVKIKLTLTTK